MVAALVASVLFVWNDPASIGRYQVRQADSLLRDGRYSQAVDLLERTLVTYSGPDARLELSYAYLARRDSVRAQTQAVLVTETAPLGLQPTAWAQLGRVLSFEGQSDRAVAAWERAIQVAAQFGSGPPVEEQARSSRWHIAMTHWAAGNWDAARSDLTALLNGNNNDVYAISARVKLGQLLAPTDRARSLQLLAEAAGSVPQAPTSSDLSAGPYSVPDLNLPGLGEGLPRAVITSTVREVRATHQQVNSAKQGGSSQAVVDAAWGAAFLQQSEPQLARLYLESALALQPDFADARARLGVALLDLGDTQGALAQLQSAVRTAPGQPLAHHVLATIYTQQGDWPKAQAEFQTLSRIEPDNAQLHIQMADYYIGTGEYDKAEEQYIDAAGLQATQGAQGDAADSANVDAPLLLARFYEDVRGQGCDKGLAVARQFAPAHPNNPNWLDAVGWGYVLCGRPTDALPALEPAVAGSPGVPRYRYHLGKAYVLLGRYSDAREQFNRVRDLDPGGPWERLALADLVKLPK